MPTNKTIKFHLIKDFPDQIVLPPIPSKKIVPPWFKNLSPKVEDKNLGKISSVKRCMPFLDAMTAGYTMLMHMDALIELTPEGKIHLPYLDDHHRALVERWNPIESHPASQVKGSAFENMTILKYMNPWVIETPKDYSVLYLPCINRLESPIIPLTGLVDSDVYNNVVNIPFIHTELEPGGRVFIPAGTPICQVIPVKRDIWTQQVTLLNKQELKNVSRMRKEMDKDREDYYMKKLHLKKNYD
jgi:hypothetical protein